MGKEGIPIPWLLKFRKFQLKGYRLHFFAAYFLKESPRIEDVYLFNRNFVELKKLKKEEKLTKIDFIFYSLKRNLVAIKKVKIVLKKKFDIIYSPSSVLDLTLFPFLLKILKLKIKWVAVFDNIVPLTDPGNKLVRFLAWLFFQISLLLLRKADCIFVISKDLKDYLLNRGFDKNKIILTGNAVEVDLIKKAKPDPKYKIDALFVGRINETKGIYDMLDVLEIIKERYPNFQLAIMGRGDINTERKYKEEIKKRRLEKNVKFLGFKTGLEKFNIIKSSKIFLFLSKSESFGIALLEAVCCGIKAFAYDLPAYRNIYKNNEVLIFKKNDFRSVAKAILETFDKQDFGNPAGVKLLNKYSWDKIAEIELNSFRKLVI